MLDDLFASLVLLQLGVELGLHLADGLLNYGQVVGTFADVELIEGRLLHDQLVLVANVAQSLVLLILETVLLLLHVLHTAALLHANLIESLNFSSGFLDRLLVLGSANDVLQIFEKTIFMFVGGLGLHLGDGLDLTLQNEETLVVQVNATSTEEGSDRGEIGLFSIDVIFARVVLEHFP